MADPRDEEIERLRRSVLSLAGVVSDLLRVLQDHQHYGSSPPSLADQSRLRALEGRVSAIDSLQGIGDRQAGRGEGGADG